MIGSFFDVKVFLTISFIIPVKKLSVLRDLNLTLYLRHTRNGVILCLKEKIRCKKANMDTIFTVSWWINK
jgi:hypothetical protein